MLNIKKELITKKTKGIKSPNKNPVKNSLL